MCHLRPFLSTIVLAIHLHGSPCTCLLVQGYSICRPMASLIDMLDKKGEDDILAFVEDNVDCGQKYEDTRYFLPFKVVKNLRVA